MRESFRFSLRTPVAVLSSAAPKLPPPPPAVSARDGAPSVWKPFLLHGSLPRVQVLSLFFCLRFSFFLLPYPGTWGASCLLGGLRSSVMGCLSFASFNYRCDTASPIFFFSLPLFPLYLHKFVLPEYNLTWPQGYMTPVQITI